jgi:hypothetical protein
MIFASTINYVSSHVIIYALEVLEFHILWYWLVLSSTVGVWYYMWGESPPLVDTAMQKEQWKLLFLCCLHFLTDSFLFRSSPFTWVNTNAKTPTTPGIKIWAVIHREQQYEQAPKSLFNPPQCKIKYHTPTAVGAWYYKMSLFFFSFFIFVAQEEQLKLLFLQCFNL